MRKNILFFFVFFVSICLDAQIASIDTYLKPTVLEFQKTWPNNKTMNLVFHGHSVPSGYFATPTVNTLLAYPNLTLENLKRLYPYAVINTITTSIGGENSEQGQLRFASEALTMKPDVVFIDYAINDRGIGLERARATWVKMIEASITYGCKIMLMTPTPVSTESLTDAQSPLALQAALIRELAATYHVGLIDSYKAFQDLATSGVDLSSYYAQPVHVNEKGHKVVADEIKKWFIVTPSEKPINTHFDFESNTTTTTTDRISNKTATFYGTSVVNDLERGNVLSLPTMQSYLKIAENPLYNSSYAISFWIKLSVEEFDRHAFYFTEASGKHMLGLTKENWYAPKQFCFYNKNVSGICGIAEKLEVGKWNHLVITGSADAATMYINGVRKSSRTLAISALTFTDFYVGTPNNTTFIGFMDDVMFYNSLLTDSQIASLYNLQNVNPSALKNTNSNINIKFSPNPVRTKETVHFDLSELSQNEPVKFEVFSVDGKMKYSNIINPVEARNFTYIPTENGLLLLTFKNNYFNRNIKLIVQ